MQPGYFVKSKSDKTARKKMFGIIKKLKANDRLEIIWHLPYSHRKTVKGNTIASDIEIVDAAIVPIRIKKNLETIYHTASHS